MGGQDRGEHVAAKDSRPGHAHGQVALRGRGGFSPGGHRGQHRADAHADHHAQAIEHRHRGGEAAGHHAGRHQGKGGQDDAAAPQPVGQRRDAHAADRHADQAGAEQQAHGIGADAPVCLKPGR
jgi:hypothetical protein